MTPQQYLESILNKYKIDEGKVERLKNIRAEVERKLKANYNTKIESVRYSGSYAKQTAISLNYDLDICVYFRKNSFFTLSDMYYDVGAFLKNNFIKYCPRKQRVSWGLETYDGMSLDIVPARSLENSIGDAHLYSSDDNSYIKTNLTIHKNFISDSGLRPVIKLIKIWKSLHNLHYKSFGLELLTIKTLKGCENDPLPTQFLKVIENIANNGMTVSLLDPANSNNDVSKAISYYDKSTIVSAAKSSLNEQYWEKIIW